MKVGDLVQYIRDMPHSYAEFQTGVRCNDIGLVTDALENGTTVRVRWFKDNNELKEIIENIKWRHQTISNIIKWKQFESGN